jgi:hypothetical protein
MNRKLVLRVERSMLFPAEKDETVDSYLQGTSRSIALLSGSTFAAFDKKNPVVRDNFKVLSFWFNAENNSFANSVYQKINSISKGGHEAVILNIHTSLKLLEKGFSLPETQTGTNTEVEKNMFKAYILMNEIDNKKDNNILDSLKDQPTEIKFPLLVLTQTFRYADISVVNYPEVFSEQFVKAILFFEYIEKSHPKILSSFLSFYRCNSWQHYLRKIFPLIHCCLKNTQDKPTDINVKRDREFEENIQFIDKLSFVDEIEELKDSDFVSLRSKPFFRKNEDTYRVIYDLFVFEKVFNSIFFTLRSIKELNEVNLKDIFTYQFSEKVVLYTLMSRIFSRCICKYSGADLDQRKISGAPDYYVRRKKQIFIFESKDVVLNTEIKESTSFEIYREEIKKKLYFDDSSGKVKSKAIKQLIHNIRNLLKSEISFDKIKGSERIYPIIVVHNRQLNVAGLNHLLCEWFRFELQELSNQGLKVKKVAQLTVINIATLIQYSDAFQLKHSCLNEKIEEYHRATSLRAKNVARTEVELENNLMSRIIPFNLFINRRIKTKSPSILRKNMKLILNK